jgi:hypothetical protein
VGVGRNSVIALAIGVVGALLCGVVLAMNGVDVRNGAHEIITVGFCGLITSAALAAFVKAFVQ